MCVFACVCAGVRMRVCVCSSVCVCVCGRRGVAKDVRHASCAWHDPLHTYDTDTHGNLAKRRRRGCTLREEENGTLPCPSLRIVKRYTIAKQPIKQVIPCVSWMCGEKTKTMACTYVVNIVNMASLFFQGIPIYAYCLRMHMQWLNVREEIDDVYLSSKCSEQIHSLFRQCTPIHQCQTHIRLNVRGKSMMFLV